MSRIFEEVLIKRASTRGIVVFSLLIALIVLAVINNVAWQVIVGLPAAIYFFTKK